MARDLDLVVLFEHPEWQKPLFAALEQRGIAFEPFDLKRAAFSKQKHILTLVSSDPGLRAYWFTFGP